jgi:redox-sensitive bicupin YhaK (pirin superfamily)
MDACGQGLVHAETSSDEFRKNGGPLEILQLWVNLPAKHKMAAPCYTGYRPRIFRL